MQSIGNASQLLDVEVHSLESRPKQCSIAVHDCLVCCAGIKAVLDKHKDAKLRVHLRVDISGLLTPKSADATADVTQEYEVQISQTLLTHNRDSCLCHAGIKAVLDKHKDAKLSVHFKADISGLLTPESADATADVAEEYEVQVPAAQADNDTTAEVRHIRCFILSVCGVT